MKNFSVCMFLLVISILPQVGMSASRGPSGSRLDFAWVIWLGPLAMKPDDFYMGVTSKQLSIIANCFGPRYEKSAFDASGLLEPRGFGGLLTFDRLSLFMRLYANESLERSVCSKLDIPAVQAALSAPDLLDTPEGVGLIEKLTPFAIAQLQSAYEAFHSHGLGNGWCGSKTRDSVLGPILCEEATLLGRPVFATRFSLTRSCAVLLVATPPSTDSPASVTTILLRPSEFNSTIMDSLALHPKAYPLSSASKYRRDDPSFFAAVYHPGMTHAQAQEMIAGKPPGTCLLRDSRSKPGWFTFAVSDHAKKCQQFLLNVRPDGYVMNEAGDCSPNIASFARGISMLRTPLPSFAHGGSSEEG